MKSIAFNLERFKILKRNGISSFQFPGVLRFLGRSALALLVLNGFGSIFLALSEIAVAAFIQLFLVALGLIPPTLSGIFANIKFSVWEACIFLALVGVIRSIGQYLTSLSSGFAQTVLQDRMRTTLLAKVIYSDSPPSASNVLNLTSEIFPKAASFAYSSAKFLAIGSQMIVLFVVMMIVTWKEASVALAFFLILGLWVIKINRIVRQHGSDLPAKHENVVRTLNRVTSNWLLLHLLGTQNEEFYRSAADVHAYTSQSKRTHRLAVLSGSIPPLIGIMILIGVILLSQSYFATQASKLLIFLYLFVRFIQNLAGGLGALGDCHSNYSHFKRAYQFFLESELIHRKALEGHSEPRQEERLKCPRAPVEVVIKDLSFRYEGAEDFGLDKLSLSINAGEQVGIVGRSGVGKSTLLSLILGIYRPIAGSIQIDGLQASDALKNRKYSLGYVGPEPFLFEGSLLNNLLYGNRARPDEPQIIKILHTLSLFENEKKPLELPVLSGGANFSTGQRQRICIARALLNNPQFLVLDEVSANLDAQTEAALAETLKALKGICTVLIVTHRAGIIKYSDKVLNLS